MTKLMPEDKRPKMISVTMVENAIARMAKIPPKTVVADEAGRLKTLKEDLKDDLKETFKQAFKEALKEAFKEAFK